MGRRRRSAWKLRAAALVTVALLLVVVATATRSSSTAPSECRGTPANGSLESAWRLPRTGPNFRAYSDLGWTAGRTWVHSAVHRVVLDAYRRLDPTDGERTWVYGETGWRNGGRIRPHRTHQNGLSVDFMVPILDADGRPAELPTSALNRFGYDVELDDAGRFDGGRIDFDVPCAP